MDTSDFPSDSPETFGEDSSFPAPKPSAPAPAPSSEAGQSEAGQGEATTPPVPGTRPNGGRNFRNRRFRGRKQNQQGCRGRQNRGHRPADGNRGGGFTGPTDHTY